MRCELEVHLPMPAEQLTLGDLEGGIAKPGSEAPEGVIPTIATTSGRACLDDFRLLEDSPRQIVPTSLVSRAEQSYPAASLKEDGLIDDVSRALRRFKGRTTLQTIFWDCLGYLRVGEPLPPAAFSPRLREAIEEAYLLARHEGVYVCAARLRDGRFSQHWREAALSQIRTRFGTAIVVLGDAAWSRATFSWADDGRAGVRGSMRLWPLLKRDIRRVSERLLLLRAYDRFFAPRGTLDLAASFIHLGETGGDEVGAPGAREPAVDPDRLYDRLFAEHPPMGREETRRLFRALAELTVEERNGSKREEYLRLRNRLILGHMRLCVSAIKHFGFVRRCLSLDRLDLMQEGVFGLARAIDRFDVGQGTEFSTYAYPWIRQVIGRTIELKDRLIRIPSHCFRKKTRLPDREWRRFNKILSLSANERGVAQGLIDFGVDIPPQGLLRHEVLPAVRACIEECLRAVHGRRREILERRFGLGGHVAQTLQEIADAFGLTRERVRQIEQKTLMSIRATPLFERVQELIDEGGRT